MTEHQNGEQSPKGKNQPAPWVTIPDVSVEQRPVWFGVVLGLLLHGIQLLCWPVAVLLGDAIPNAAWAFVYSPFLIGLTQLVYIVPAILITRRQGQRAMVKGLIICASITALLNGTCWGWFLVAKPRIGG
jgi:hypothetical protein